MFLAVVILAGGCGGGGDGGDGGSGGTLTKDELAAQANAICADTEEQINALKTPTTLDDLADATEQVQGIFEDGLDDMRQPEPPADLQDEFDEFISVNEDQVVLLGDLADAARSGYEANVAQISDDGEESESRSDELARGFGAKECADD